MYLYLSSDASSDLFSTNSANSFTQKLPRRITQSEIARFSNKQGWEVALVDLRTPRFVDDNTCESLTIFCNICEVSVHENDMSPVLTVAHRPIGQFNTMKPLIVTIDTPRYVRVTDHTLEYIKLYLLDQEGRDIPFQRGSLRCTLHLRPTLE
jgi:hypothetical protein